MNNGGVAIVVCGVLAAYGTYAEWQHMEALWGLFVIVLIVVGTAATPEVRRQKDG